MLYWYYSLKINKKTMKTKTKIKRWFRYEHKDHPILFPIMLFVALFGVIVHINNLVTIKTSNIAEFEAIQGVEAREVEELSMKDWVLRRVEQNGLDKYEAYMIIQCESRWKPDVISKINSNKTIDRGLWQINSIHKDISNAQALDYQYATDWAIKKRLEKGNWSAWVCAKKLGI